MYVDTHKCLALSPSPSGSLYMCYLDSKNDCYQFLQPCSEDPYPTTHLIPHVLEPAHMSFSRAHCLQLFPGLHSVKRHHVDSLKPAMVVKASINQAFYFFAQTSCF